MEHLLLMKFQPGEYTRERIAHVKEVYKSIADAVETVKSAKVYTNCVERDQNMDLFVWLKMERDSLNEYLSHPLHAAFVQESKTYVKSIVSFDYIEEVGA